MSAQRYVLSDGPTAAMETK